METIETSQLLVPLTSQAHKKGLEFAAEQKNVTEGKQVYLNTLAVMAVHQCLQWVGIESDFGECNVGHMYLILYRKRDFMF